MDNYEERIKHYIYIHIYKYIYDMDHNDITAKDEGQPMSSWTTFQ